MISLCILTTCLCDHVWIIEGEVTYQLLLGVKDLTCCPNSIDPFCFPPKYYHGYYEWMQIQNLYVFMIFSFKQVLIPFLFSSVDSHFENFAFQVFLDKLLKMIIWDSCNLNQEFRICCLVLHT